MKSEFTQEIVWPKTITVIFSLLITTTLCLYYQIPYGYFSVITVFALLQLFYSEIRPKILERIIGPAVAFILTLSLIKIIDLHFLTNLIISSFLVFIFMYYYAQQRYTYATLMGGMTVAIMGISAHTNSNDFAINLGLYWVLNVMLGSFIVFFVNFFVQHFWIKPSKPTFIGQKHLTEAEFILKLKKHMNEWYIKSHYQYSSFLIATRITLTLILITIINHYMNWENIALQATIAGILVSAQLTREKTYQRAIFRITGILLGSFLAIAYAFLLAIYPYPILALLLIVITISICSVMGDLNPTYDYLYLQAGLMVPLILLTSTQNYQNTGLALQRALGSLEGGFIAIIMIHLFSLFLTNTHTNEPTKNSE